MPYPNEHSCRIKSPGAFQKDDFKRIIRDHLVIIIGRLKGQKTTTTQAYRYPIKDWTKKEAREHCKEAKGEFHPATKETQHSMLRFFGKNGR